MAWQDSLQDASFKGVPLDVINISDSLKNSLVQNRIPYTNGAELENMGGDAEPVRMQIIFWGDDYEVRLKAFKEAFSSGAGELVHPIEGPLQVIGDTCEVIHDAEATDSCTLSVVFIRDGLSVSIFTEVTTRQQTEVALNAATEALAASVAVVAARTEKLSLLQSLAAGIKRATRFRDRALQALQRAKQFARGVITAGLDVINSPLAFASDVASIADGIIDLRGFDKDVIMAKWRSLGDQFRRALRLPNDGKVVDSDTASDDKVLTLFLGVQELYSLTAVGTAIFLSEADEATLTPANLEEITNTIRERVQDLIEQHQAFDDPIAVQPVIEALRRTADETQRTAMALLNARPPLIVREVETAMPLRLVAFKWYGDADRAAELLRLNPSIRHPSFMQPGDRLNAYAR